MRKTNVFYKLTSVLITIVFLFSNYSFACGMGDLQKNKYTLAASSRIQQFFSKNGTALSTPQEMALSMAMGRLQKSILEEKNPNITEEIWQLNVTLSLIGMKIITNNIEIDPESKIPYITISIGVSKDRFRAYFLNKDQRKINKRLMIEEKDLRHFDCRGLEGVWFVNEALRQGGTMGRWKYTHTTLVDDGALTLHNAIRIPRKDGVIEKEFLINGANSPRNIVLQTRKLTKDEREKMSAIMQELGINIEPRVIIRDNSAIRNRIYGVATQKDPSQAEIKSKFASLKDITIETVKVMAKSGQSNIRPIIELAQQICSSFDPRIPEHQWPAVTPEMFIVLNSALKYQIYLPNNEIFEILRISEEPDVVSVEIKKESWREQDYLKSKIWIAESSPATEGYLVDGLTTGWFAIVNLDNFRESGKKRYLYLKQSVFRPGERYSSPYEPVIILLMQVAQVREEDFVEGIFVEHPIQEEIKHAQDNSYVAQKLRRDNRFDSNEDEQTVSEILKPDSTLHQRVFAHLSQQAKGSKLLAKLNRQLGLRIITEYSARLGGIISEMKKHIIAGREELAFIAFLNFMEEQFFCATPEQIPSDDILKLTYISVAVLLFQDIDEWAGTPLDHTSIDVIKMLGMEPGKLPIERTLRMLEEIYAKYFWTDKERYARLSSEPFKLANPSATGIVAQGISFVREDIIAKGNQDQLKEALDHENRELATQRHDVIRNEQHQGGLRSLVTQLSRKDKDEKGAKRMHAGGRRHDGSIIQGTEAIKELNENRKAGRYKFLKDEYPDIFGQVQRVASENGISLDGIAVYGITSIVKAKKDFVHGYFARETNELFLSINIMQQARAYDISKGTKLLSEYIEHELKCNITNHQELRIQQRQKYFEYGNYKDKTEDEGRLRDTIREDTDIRAAASEFVEIIKAIGQRMQEQNEILASDTSKKIIRFNLGQGETVVAIDKETKQKIEEAYDCFRDGLNLSPGSDYIAGNETRPDNIRRRDENYDRAIYLFGELSKVPLLADLAREMQQRARGNKELAIRQTASVSPHGSRDAEIIRMSHFSRNPLAPDVSDSRIPAVEYMVAPKEVILAFNTNIGNINNNQELLKQIREIADMWGDIKFIAGAGEDALGQQIDDKIGQLQKSGTAREDIKVIVITNTSREKTKFGIYSSGYSFTFIDDAAVTNYIPLPEILSFVLMLHLEPKSSERDERLKTLYHVITGYELTDESIQKIRWAEIPIILPRAEKISVEVYKGAFEVWKAA